MTKLVLQRLWERDHEDCRAGCKTLRNTRSGPSQLLRLTGGGGVP